MLADSFSLEQLKELEKKLVKEGNFKELIAVLERKIQLDASRGSDYYCEIGNIYREHIKNQAMAIDAFKKAITLKPDCFRAFQAVRSIFLVQENWEQYLLFGEKQLAFTSDPQQIMDLHFSLADIYSRLNMLDKAQEHLLQVYCFDPCHLYAFEKLSAFYKKAEKWQEYAKILENHLPGSTTELVARFIEIADVYSHRLQNNQEAALFYEKAHLLSPFEEDILVALQNAAQKMGDQEKRIYALEKRIGLCKDKGKKYALFMEAGEILLHKGQDEKAASVYEKAYEAKPDAIEILDILSKLYHSQGKDKELLLCLEKKASLALPKETSKSLWLQIAELAQKLGDLPKAIVYYEKVLPSQDEEIVKALLVLYESEKEWRKLADLYEQISLSEPKEKQIEILQKLISLYEMDLKDEKRLKDCLYRSFCLSGLSQERLFQLEKLAKNQADWKIVIEVLEEKAKQGKENKEIASFCLEIAEIYHHRLGEAKQAIHFYRKAWEKDSDNDKFLKEIQNLYIFQKDYENALDIIEERLKKSQDSKSQYDILIEKGFLLRDKCQKVQEASDAFEKAISVFPSCMQAIESLEGIYCKEEKFPQWIAVLFKKQSMVNAQDKIAIAMKIAFLYEEGLKDDTKAQETLEQIWKECGFHEDVFYQLRRLCYKHQSWETLQKIYQDAIVQSQNIALKAQLTFSFGKFYEENKVDVSQAALLYLQVLAIKPGHLNAIRSLQKIYSKEKKYPSLVEAYLAELALMEIAPGRRIYLHLQCAQLFSILKKNEGAIQHYKLALKLDAGNLFAIRNLQEIYRSLSEKKELLPLLMVEMRIERKEIRLFEIYRELGYLYRDFMQNEPEAIQNLTKAYSYYPKEKQILQDLKDLLAKQNRWEEYAVYLEEEAKEKNWNEPKEIHRRLIEVYKKLENSEKLIFHLEKILLYPPFALEDILLLKELYIKQNEEQNQDKLFALYSLESQIVEAPERKREILFKKASYYMKKENILDAISCLEKILQENILHQEAFAMLSRLYIKKQMWSELGNLYVRFAYCAKEQKEKEDLLLKAGAIWDKKAGDSGKAIGYYYQVLTMNPQNSSASKAILKILEQSKDWYMAIEILYQQAKGLTGKEKASVYYKIAQIWELKLMDIVQALKAYLVMLETHFHLETAEHIVPMLQAAKDYYSLASVLKKIIRNTQDSSQKAERYLELGNLLFYEFQKTQEAIKAYKKVLKHNPQKLEALIALEEIYTQEKDWEELCQTKEKRLEISSNPIDIKELHLELGKLYHKNILHQKKAIFHYESALELQSEPWPDLYFTTLEELYKEWGYFDKYISLAEKEIASSGSPERKKILLGNIAHLWEKNLFDSAAAIKTWERLLDLDENNQEAMANLIRLYEQNLDYANLVSILERKQNCMEKSSTEERLALYLLIARLCLQKLSSHEKAIQYYNSALALDSQNSEAMQALEEIAEKSRDREMLEKILQKKLELCSQEEEKAKLYCKLGKLYMESSLQKASEYYELAHESMPLELSILDILKELYHKQKDIEKAMKINAKILALTSKEDQKVLLYLEVSQMLIENNTKEAIEYLHKVLLFKSDHKEALSLCAKIYYKMQDWEKARDLYTKWLSIESEPLARTEILEKRGQVYLHLGDKENAIQDWEQVFQYHPDHFEIAARLSHLYQDSGELTKAQTLYDLIIHWPDRSQIHTSLSLANLYFESGEIASLLGKKQIALLRYLQALQSNPEHKESLKKVAQIYYDNKQWEESLLVFMKYKSLYPLELEEEKEIALKISVIKEKMGMAQGAIEGYLHALETDKKNPFILESLGNLYWENKEEDKALLYLTQAEEMYPDFPEKQRLLKKIALVYESQSNSKLATETYERLLEYFPLEQEYLHKLARLYQKTGNWEKAEKYLLLLCEKSQKDLEKAECFFHLGIVYKDGYNKDQETISYFHKALAVLPSYLPAISMLAFIHQKKEDWKNLVRCYEECLRAFPLQNQEETLPFLLELANVVWERLGDTPKAIEIYQKILQIAPDHKIAHLHLATLCRQYPEKREEAIMEHRYILSQDTFRSHSYHELFFMYREGSEYDRAYLCCMNLSALNKLSVEEKRFLSQVQPRVPSGWLDSSALDTLIQEQSRGTLYEIMSAMDPFMDRIYPLSEQEYAGKQRLSLDSDQKIEHIINNTMRLLQISELAVYLIPGKKILLENTQPPCMFIGKECLGLGTASLYFLIGKSLFYVSRNQVMAAKLSFEDYNNYVLRIVEAFAETGKQVSLEEEALSRKIRNALPKRLRKPWEERMDIFTEIYNTDTKEYQKFLEIAANRCGLLLSDCLPEACYAFLLSKNSELKKLEDCKDHPEIQEMFAFNISDEIVTLRKELGIDVKWINRL